jgi:preprotein translocase subunit SecE
MLNVAKFLAEAKSELKKVVWPKKEEIARLTMVVVLASVLVGFFLAGADLIFSRLIRLIVGY